MADDTGTDWAATATEIEGFSCTNWECDHHECKFLRAAAVGLRRLAQLDTAIGPPMRLMDLMARSTTMDAEGDELAERLTLIYVAAVAEGAEDRGQTGGGSTKR